MRLTPIKTLAPRGTAAPPDADVRCENGRRVLNTGYAALLERFVASDHILARVDSPDFPARVVYRGLRSARASAPDTFGYLDVILRGGDVYVSKQGTASARKAARADAADMLARFDASGALSWYAPGDHALYRALHYRRTALGLGHIRVIREDNGVTLVNTLVDTPSDAV